MASAAAAPYSLPHLTMGAWGWGRVGSRRGIYLQDSERINARRERVAVGLDEEPAILRDFDLRVRDHAVNHMVGFEIHDEALIFPPRNRWLAYGGNFGDRSAEFGRYLVHGHAASRCGDIGLLDRNAAVDRNGLCPRE